MTGLPWVAGSGSGVRLAAVALALLAGAASAVAAEAGAAEPAPAEAAGLPLWELGLGAGVLRLPHYRGSDQSHTWVLPVPYLVYRGDILRADRDGARAVLLEQGAVDLHFSVAASAPTRSSDNDARSGMPDLPATFELGPNLQWHLARGRDWGLDLRLPVRAVITIEGPPRHAGWTAVPQVALDTRWRGWNVGALVGASFGDRRVHALYYEVAPEFATQARPAYRAEGGRAGWQMIGAVSRRVGDLWFGAYLRADRLDDAVFVTSPLVRQRGSLAGGLALAWVFGQSATRVAPRTAMEGGSR